ncbi:MAG TPA: histone deacetylase, partial [Gemmatimonadales bacterium]
MAVPIFTHPDCLLHDPGPDHPEAPARLRVLLERARAEPGVEVHEAPAASIQPLLEVHPLDYLDLLQAMSARGGGALSLDTVLNDASWRAVLGATGAVLAAVDHAHAGRGNAFAAVRPPGHHALASRGMGFCLTGNAIVAARHAQQAGRERVLIVDWDVHHGNGTQALMEHDETVRYVSLHQHPWYPGTGLAHERGVGNVF